LATVSRRSFLLLGAAVALGGCAGVAPLPGGERAYRETVSFGGRLLVRYPQDGKPQSVQGKFLWAQRRESTTIELYSPLGQTLARIAIEPGRATLETAGGRSRAAATADALTEETLGWPLPVDGLRYWLQGFVRSGERTLVAAAPEGPESFRSDGWRVRVASWQQAGSSALPKRIDLEREDIAGGPIALRLVIDDWRTSD
jgi:outer membrane lipoprotein LolB